MNDSKKISFTTKLLAIACFVTNISQLPFFVEIGATQMLNMPMWIVVVAYLIFTNKWTKLSIRMCKMFFYSAIVVAGCLFFSIITEFEYWYSGMLNSLLISLFIYTIGAFSSRYINRREINFIMWSYVISACLVAINIYFIFFHGNIDLSSSVYAYASKNSISQIILTSIIIMMLVNEKKSYWFNRVRVFGIFFQVFLLVLLRSRATLFGFFVCLAYMVFIGKINRKLKNALLITIIAGMFFLIFNEQFAFGFLNNVIFAGRDVNSLDSLTSGRISILNTFPTLIEGHYLTGIGSIYFECFPASVILNYGIILGIVVLIVSYTPIVYSFGGRKNKQYGILFFMVCLCYAINSLFEGLAPIGPGVKCYFMWLLYGIFSEKKHGDTYGEC